MTEVLDLKECRDVNRVLLLEKKKKIYIQSTKKL